MENCNEKKEFAAVLNTFACEVIGELQHEKYNYQNCHTANSLYLDSSMLNEWIEDVAKLDKIQYDTDIWHETEQENKVEIQNTLDVINNLLSLLITKVSGKYYDNFNNHEYHINSEIEGCELCEIESDLSDSDQKSLVSDYRNSR